MGIKENFLLIDSVVDYHHEDDTATPEKVRNLVSEHFEVDIPLEEVDYILKNKTSITETYYEKFSF